MSFATWYITASVSHCQKTVKAKIASRKPALLSYQYLLWSLIVAPANMIMLSYERPHFLCSLRGFLHWHSLRWPSARKLPFHFAAMFLFGGQGGQAAHLTPRQDSLLSACRTCFRGLRSVCVCVWFYSGGAVGQSTRRLSWFVALGIANELCIWSKL